MQKLYTGNNCDIQIVKPKLILVTSHVISLKQVVIKYLFGWVWSRQKARPDFSWD